MQLMLMMLGSADPTKPADSHDGAIRFCAPLNTS